ncbi:MAG TPA: HDOD domain-containing protein [Pirellulales bacterium]|nr:HDOD domain-containing protein [Pirellulales bacterium]
MEATPDLLAQLLNHSRQLYSLPAVVLEVLELTNAPQLDTNRLKECIERDPALTTKVLRVVNSSLFGLSRRVSDLTQALSVLGTKPLKMLVLGFGLPEPLFAGLARDVLDQFWKHTLTRAVAARELSEKVWRLPGDELFVAGLLKDLGRLVLIQGLGKPYVEVLRKADWPRDEVRALERRLIGFDHIQLTAGLLEQWGLPEMLVAAVQWPDVRAEIELLSGDVRTPAEILHLAERLAELLADERADALATLLQAARGGPTFSEKQLAAITASVEETVTQLAAVLSVDLSQGLAYNAVLARAYTQLSLVACDAAEELLDGGRQGLAQKLSNFADGDAGRSLSSAVASLPATPAPRTSPHSTEPKRADLGPRRTSSTAATARSVSVAACAAGRGGPAGRGVSAVAVVDATLQAYLTSAAALCRQTRRELSLLLIELDGLDDLLFMQGVAGSKKVRDAVFDACRAAGSNHFPPLELTASRLALVLPGCDRPGAADVGHHVLHEVRQRIAGGGVASVSVGASTVAVPAKNFGPFDIISSAERCLRAAQLSGGGCFKSIEAY